MLTHVDTAKLHELSELATSAGHQDCALALHKLIAEHKELLERATVLTKNVGMLSGVMAAAELPQAPVAAPPPAPTSAVPASPTDQWSTQILVTTHELETFIGLVEKKVAEATANKEKAVVKALKKLGTMLKDGKEVLGGMGDILGALDNEISKTKAKH
jgi:hypothetical protein